MKRGITIKARQYKAFTQKDIDQIPMLKHLPPDYVDAMKVVSKVFPFRANNYVIDELIDWNNIPDDPIFQLTFPQPDMLEEEDFELIDGLIKNKAPEEEIREMAMRILVSLNPHPGGQMEHNVPRENGRVYNGLQHKYNETVLFFPAQGQTCHAFCTFCFRWPQFSKLGNLKFASNDVDILRDYLNSHPEVTDVLFTGGDPLVMRTKVLKSYIEPLINDKPGNLQTIRIGTKVPSFWPYRFVTDKDAYDLLRLFEDVVRNGFHLSIMAHFSHYRELETAVAQKAMKRILSTGANIRCQSPVIRYVNDDPAVWTKMWQLQTSLGAIPYYMFVARDTGPKHYFNLTLARAYDIFTRAYSRTSGLCRTVRGPSMSATPGKVMVCGVSEVNGEQVYVLKFIQSRKPEWVNRIFFAEFNEDACWLDDLKPAFGEEKFFFEEYMGETEVKEDFVSDRIYAGSKSFEPQSAITFRDNML